MNILSLKYFFSCGFVPAMLFYYFRAQIFVPVQSESLYKQADFPIGVSVKIEKLKNDEPYREIVISQFNSITAERVMKPDLMHPQKDVFYFNDADYLVDFCRKNNKRLHGHTLIWHKRLPSWIENFRGNRYAWEDILKTHIQTLVGHYKSDVQSWDLINEAFNDDGSLRDNVWLKNIGETYIEKCFMYANEIAPEVKFFYNDYNLESNNRKLNAVLQMVDNLKSKGIKIDGIGMQMHIRDIYPDISKINLAAVRIQEKGLLVHYSELDISLNKHGDKSALTPDMLEAQKRRIIDVVEGYKKLQKKYQFGITIWGLDDAGAWLGRQAYKDWPLLYDENYMPKPVYFGLLEALKR